MFERFDDSARATLVYVTEEAEGFEAPEISPELLLLAVLRRPEVLEVANRGGVDLESLRRECRAVTPNVFPPAVRPFSERCKSVLFRASEAAKAAGRRHVSSTHVFISLLGDPSVRQLLERAGANLAALDEWSSGAA